MYHCAPVVEAYTAMRKRSFAQKVLGGNDAHAEIDDSRAMMQKAFEQVDANKKLLACNTVEEPKMKNHTCVLSPVVTQGPYYHTEGHPIRQNMAEMQLGQLFVRLALPPPEGRSTMAQLMDIGVLDAETCQPLEGVLVDLWVRTCFFYHAISSHALSTATPPVTTPDTATQRLISSTNDRPKADPDTACSPPTLAGMLTRPGYEAPGRPTRTV